MALLLLLNAFAVAQPKFVYRGQKLISVSSLVEDSTFCYADGPHRGVITRLTDEWPDFEIWVKTSKGTKKGILDVKNVSMADFSHINANLKKGRNITIGIQVCGSGAFPWVDSIRFN